MRIYFDENISHYIAGGRPMMYVEPVDVGHKCVRWVNRALGRLPQ